MSHPRKEKDDAKEVKKEEKKSYSFTGNPPPPPARLHSAESVRDILGLKSTEDKIHFLTTKGFEFTPTFHNYLKTKRHFSLQKIIDHAEFRDFVKSALTPEIQDKLAQKTEEEMNMFIQLLENHFARGTLEGKFSSSSEMWNEFVAKLSSSSSSPKPKPFAF